MTVSRFRVASHLLVGLILVGTTLVGCGGSAQSTDLPKKAPISEQEVARTAEPADRGDPSPGSGGGMAAMQRTAQAGKYLFAFFWKAEDEQTLAMRKVFDQAIAKASDRADGVAVNVTEPSEKKIVDLFGLDRAPMPLVLAIAPNGAVTGGFPSEFNEQQLLDAFATPCTEKCMKPLQDGKLVFLCVQNAKTESNDAAMQGVDDFRADERFAEATEVVMLDPADAAEADFLADLQISPQTAKAVTVFLVPPGSPVAMYEGETAKAQLVETLEKAASGCCPGGSCGPNGCAPPP